MDRLTMTMLRIGQATRSIGLKEAREVGLTPVQAQSLLFVKHTKRFATSVGQLAAHLGASHASAVGVVSGLVEHGLLEREPSEYDRRVTLLRLTPKGEIACQRLNSWGHLLSEALAGLSPDERAALERGLGGVVWSLRAAGHLTVAEPCRGCTFFREGADPNPDAAEPHYCDLIQSFISEDESLKDCPDHIPLTAASNRLDSGNPPDSPLQGE